MHPLVFAKQRLAAFREEVERLERSEFPYPAAEEALQRIKEECDKEAANLDLLEEGDDAKTINERCKQLLTLLWEYLPFLGFILRSTYVRNAFEIYMPLQRLAWRVLGPKARLLISSEWFDSPFTYTQVPLLPSFVLIGVPAHESGNPLITPGAGHELGHALWAEVVEKSLWNSAFNSRLETVIVDKIRAQWVAFHELYPMVTKPEDLNTDWIYMATWASAFAWAKRQSEEYFCDFVGLRLFGESFLYAFAYLLSPGSEGRRALHYPNMLRRVRFQIQAARQYGIKVPDNYETWFEDREEPSDEDRHDKFLVGLADSAADGLAPELITHANSLLHRPDLPDWSNEEQQKNHAAIEQQIYDDFVLVAPAERTQYIAHILNAGWKAAKDGIPKLINHSSEAVLRELLLKSLDVLEYEAKNPINKT